MTAALGEYVQRMHREGHLVVQPRMGFSDAARMRTGLLATAAVPAAVSTITVDSYTRVGDTDAARKAVADGLALNGYPIAAVDPAVTAGLVAGIAVPVQVRHGSAAPRHIIAAMRRAGLSATEGGPISYCLPYGRVPLRESVANWADACAMLADSGAGAHLETFGGCMLGQMCPPSLLVAISVLEAAFFVRHGIGSVSLSYGQQANPRQDREAVRALRRLAGEFVPTADTHVVIYAYMGVYPRSACGALRLLDAAARLAASTGSERLIVKTVAEAHRIPTIAENVEALRAAARAGAATEQAATDGEEPESAVYREARTLIETVLELDPEIDRALLTAFRRGLLDVPYCLHPDNAGNSRSYLDQEGRLLWADVGRMPIRPAPTGTATPPMSAHALLVSLSKIQHAFDDPHGKVSANDHSH
jgi:methylaspartate mutase epsilon subunit